MPVFLEESELDFQCLQKKAKILIADGVQYEEAEGVGQLNRPFVLRQTKDPISGTLNKIIFEVSPVTNPIHQD